MKEEKLKNLPYDFLLSLLKYLEKKSDLDLLLKELNNSTIILEKDGYQILIQSAEELMDIKKELKSSLELVA